jgi:hypothetical protein
MHYTVRRIGIVSALKYGFVLGAVIACLPGMLCGVASAQGVEALRRWLESWQMIRINLLVETLEFDLMELLHLKQILTQVQALDQQRVWLALALAMGSMLLVGLFAALITVLAGVIYNGIAGLSGGIQVEIEPEAGAGLLQVASPAGGRPASAAEAPLPAQPEFPRRRDPTALLPSRGPKAWLALGADANRYWPLSPGVNRLGSQAGSEVTLPYPGVAGAHAEIRFQDGRFVLYDLSQGQVWVNERPIAAQHLMKDGFRLRVGTVDLVFRQQ